jgi:hypothetical protein
MDVTELRSNYILREGFFSGDPGRYVKAPDMGISLHRGPFTSEGNMESGGGLVYWGL